MYATDFAQVGANIQKRLIALGITQQFLAESLGISKQVMNKIVKGNKAINVNELARIAVILGTTTDSLLTSEAPSTNLDTLSFMGTIHDEVTSKRINQIRVAIDEIHMLEDLLYDK